MNPLPVFIMQSQNKYYVVMTCKTGYKNLQISCGDIDILDLLYIVPLQY